MRPADEDNCTTRFSMQMSSNIVDSKSNEDNNQAKRTLIRKLDLRLLPLLSVLYLLSYLDRSNIANAKLGGLERDAHLTPQQYQWALSIFFIGYVIFEVPSNIILRRWRPSKWFALIVLIWGTIAISMAAVRTASTLLLCRFLLGSFEAGLFPGIIYYMSLWYRRKEQAVRLGCFWSFSALAGAFGGLIAYSIAQIKSTNLAEWQLIFIIEGVPTIVLAIVCWFYLPDSPEHARFLTDKERQLEIDRLAEDAGASQNHSFSWSQVLSVFTDWKTYAFAIIYVCGTVTVQGITLFLPTLIQGTGQWTSVETQLMTVPPYIAAFVAILVVSRSSDYFVERSFHLVFTNLITMCGLLILMFISQEHVNILYVGIILVTCGTYANVSVKIAWFNNNFASLTRRAVASALIVSFGTLGGVISGQIYQASQKPRYFLGNTIAFCFIVTQTILVLILRVILNMINRRRSRMNNEQIEEQIDRYGGNELAGDRHPEFRYAL